MDATHPRSMRGRLIDRDAGFGQSHGIFNIRRDITRAVRNSFYLDDWFHTLVNTKTWRIVMVVCMTYILLYVIFAFMYLMASDEHGCFPELYVPTAGRNGTLVKTTGWRRFARATFFSIETMMTIGYGVDEWKTISDCPQLLLLIALQSLVGVFTSSVLFGIVLMRVSRADQRASTVAFSDKAVVRVAYDELYLVLRVAEMRKHQLTQAYVHAYAINDSGHVIGDTAAKEEGQSVHALPMSLVHPAGEMMLMTPCFIVHRLDEHSPLMPPEACVPTDPNTPPKSKGVDLPRLLRALQAQPNHHKPAAAAGGGSGSSGGMGGGGSAPPPASPSLAATEPSAHAAAMMAARMAAIKEHMINCNAEVLLLLEGVDATTSSTVQARHSYTADDICWDATFVPCARRQPSGGVRIDFDKLHAVLPLGILLPVGRWMRMPTIDLPLASGSLHSLTASYSAQYPPSLGNSLLGSANNLGSAGAAGSARAAGSGAGSAHGSSSGPASSALLPPWAGSPPSGHGQGARASLSHGASDAAEADADAASWAPPTLPPTPVN